ncbi:VOC family protein [Robiginitalea aurantiaca]|uniref:VOC family protein n=1 Tax=Robiginitalea aurantiaca TaxID=3056915 RepID=A0ABT7WHV0_9FLAO|nr:VOC family protein [Robiginitalea aurantiaca]MDM9632507.1 VOC family protein [Robiginitalea aurantiaca]
MKLGAFSLSLAVSDLAASKAFYETLGFEVFAGEEARNYLIMKNGETLIGLFQGMFEGSILTFNPGWDQEAKTQTDYDDVRQLYKTVEKAGIPVIQKSLKETSGPGSFTIQDPDGNTILFDQHV